MKFLMKHVFYKATSSNNTSMKGMTITIFKKKEA